MGPEPGGFHDNREVFDAVLRAFEEGRVEDGRRQARYLLDHIRRGNDQKSKHWLEPSLARRLDEMAPGRCTVPAAA